MEFKGTKGRWEMHPYGESVVSSEGVFVCLTTKPGVSTSEEKKHNALLISKSPEMLEMLIELVKENTARGYGQSNDVLKAKQLIKEATELK